MDFQFGRKKIVREKPEKPEKRPCKNCGFHLTYRELNAKGLCIKCQVAEYDIATQIALKKVKEKESNKLTEVEIVALQAYDILSSILKYAERKGDEVLVNTIKKEYSASKIKKYADSGMKKRSKK
ncbi:hypothetical protein SD81_032690 [Tolypothrix campylonemoides VB511288]|nr:hypothetical protein SD81_032690 [Tolypothrix campylonemoides VB511288]